MVCHHDALSGHECEQDDDKHASPTLSATDNGRVDLHRTPSSSAKLHKPHCKMTKTKFKYTYYS